MDAARADGLGGTGGCRRVGVVSDLRELFQPGAIRAATRSVRSAARRTRDRRAAGARERLGRRKRGDAWTHAADAAEMPVEQSAALVCVASTRGVVIPPSLVLILLADAMMRAHTEAVNATGASARIVNTQNIFVGALVPAAMLTCLFAVVAWTTTRRDA
jgi:hypothetical protein